MLQHLRLDASKGCNQILLESRELPAGLLFYTLETPGFTASRKMGVLR